MKLEFVTQSNRRGENPELTSERLINCWPEPAPDGARGGLVLRAAAGYGPTPFADLGDEVVRASVVSQGVLYIAAKGFLYKVASDGTVTNETFIDDDPQTTMAALNGVVGVAANGRFFTWDGATRTEPNDGAYDGAGSITALNSRFLTSEPSGRKFDWSEVGAPTTRNALNFATKEAREDATLRVQAFEDNIWVFGEASTEVFYDSGDANNAFARIPNAVHEHGIKAKRLVTAFQDQLIYVGSDNLVYQANGVSPVVISTPMVTEAIEAETPTGIFGYVARGRKFVAVRFAGRPALTVDLRTGLWWERSTGVRDGAWEIVDVQFVYGKTLAITRDGRVYELTAATTDGAQEMRRVATSRPLDMSGERFSLDSLEFRIQTGRTDIGRDLAYLIRWSGDLGNTWTPWYRYGLGGAGDYARRSVVRGLGSFRNFTCEIAISDPAQMELESDVIASVAA